MPLTEAQKQSRRAEKKRQQGFLRFCDWVTPDQKTNIKAYLRGEAEIKLKGAEMKVTDN